MGKLFWAIAIFIFIGGWMIYNAYDINMDDSDDRKTFLGEFGKWTIKVGKNLVEITGKVIEQEWLPDTGDDKDTSEKGNITKDIKRIIVIEE